MLPIIYLALLLHITITTCTHLISPALKLPTRFYPDIDPTRQQNDSIMQSHERPTSALTQRELINSVQQSISSPKAQRRIPFPCKKTQARFNNVHNCLAQRYLVPVT